MRYYELIYIVNSNVERKKVDQVMKDIGAKLESAESKLINHTVWGKKKLAYPIKGKLMVLTSLLTILEVIM